MATDLDSASINPSEKKKTCSLSTESAIRTLKDPGVSEDLLSKCSIGELAMTPKDEDDGVCWTNQSQNLSKLSDNSPSKDKKYSDFKKVSQFLR